MSYKDFDAYLKSCHYVRHNGFYQQEKVDSDLSFDVDYMSESKSVVYDILKKYPDIRYEYGIVYAFKEDIDKLNEVYEELSKKLYVSMICWTPDTHDGDYSFRVLLFDNKLQKPEPVFEKIVFEPSNEDERFVLDVCEQHNLNTDGVFVYGYPGQLEVMISAQNIIKEHLGIVHKIRYKYDDEQKRCVYYFEVDDHYYDIKKEKIFISDSFGLAYVDDVCQHYGIEHIKEHKALIVKDGDGKFEDLNKAAESLATKMSVATDMQFDVDVKDMQIETYYQVSYDENMKPDETEIFFGGLR